MTPAFRVPFSFRWLRAVVCLLTLLAFCACAKLPRPAMLPEKWLPERTVAVVSIPDLKSFRERWKETAMGQAWADPAVSYWRTNRFDRVLDDVFQKWGGGSLIPLLDLATGQAVVALEVPRDMEMRSPADRPAVYAALDFGPNVEKAKSLFEESWKGVALPSRNPKMAQIVRYGQEQRDGMGLYSSWAGSTCFLSTSEEGLAGVTARCLGLSSDLSDGSDRSDNSKKEEPLAKTPQWRKTQHLRRQGADAWAFLDVARLCDLVTAEAGKTAEGTGDSEGTTWFKAYCEWAGLDAVDAVCMDFEIRPPGFYQRTAIAARKPLRGILFAPPGSRPLKTPSWATRDLDAFSASRIQPPLAIKQSTKNMIRELAPFLDDRIVAAESAAKDYLGMELDRLLGALGTEMASLSRASKPIPDVVLLWEAPDPSVPVQAMESLARAAGGTTDRRAFMGHDYQSYTIPPLPFPIYSAEVDGFFMIALQNRWFQDYLTTKELLVLSGTALKPEAPMGPQSLLPDLEAPFEKAPRNMTVTGRSYGNLGPGLRNLNTWLPLLPLMVNSQLKQYDLPRMPSWVASCIPPLGPFAKRMFPSVGRTMQRDGLVVSESYSPLDPAGSPFLAAGLTIGARYYLEQRKTAAKGNR